jgi:hypothetical protein
LILRDIAVEDESCSIELFQSDNTLFSFHREVTQATILFTILHRTSINASTYQMTKISRRMEAETNYEKFPTIGAAPSVAV